MLGRRPFQRHAFTSPFLQCLPVDGDCPFELRRSALALPEPESPSPQISLRHRSIEWRPLSGPFLQRLAKGGDGLFELRRPALAPAENSKRNAHSVLNPSPVERHALATRQID